MQLDQRTPFDELEARGKRPSSAGMVPFHISSEDSEQAGGAGLAANTSSSLVAGETLNVLVVDDDAIELRLLTKNLTAGGHRVRCAGNGQDALKQTLEDPPQLIITDLMMPELDGISFCKLLRQSKRGRQIYVLMLTSCEDEERVVEAFDAGADDYLIKPFRPKALLARIRAGRRIIQLQREVARDREELARYAADLAAVNRRLQQAAFTDSLTGLPNRRYAMDRLNQAWVESVRAGHSLSCLMIDIDHFKNVNDTHGHDIGDLVLRETAAVLSDSSRGPNPLRSTDVVCRLGGEEFLALCLNTDLEAARACAERLRSLVEEHVIRTPRLHMQVTISVGLAARHPAMRDINDLLKAADTAVYAAKQNGRNCVCMAQIPAANQ